MRKAWIVRPFIANDSTNYTDKFVQGSYIATGPNKLPDVRRYSVENIKKILAESRLADGAYRIGALATVVNNFVSKMKEMDLALLVNGDEIYVMEIIGDYFYAYNAYAASGFHCHKRKVKFLQRYMRSDLSETMRLALKSGRQVADISRHFNEVYKLAYGEDLELEKKDASPVEVAYPLRQDFQVKFTVPGDMTRDEARRLESFFRNLYFEK